MGFFGFGKKPPRGETEVTPQEIDQALAEVETGSDMEGLKERLGELRFVENIAGVRYYCDGKEHFSVKEPWKSGSVLKEKGQILKLPRMECDGKCGASETQKFKVDATFNPAEWVIDESLTK